jgi:hypothetical protein
VTTKWNIHINNISTSVSQKLSMLRNLEFILKRDSINKIYLAFIKIHVYRE